MTDDEKMIIMMRIVDTTRMKRRRIPMTSGRMRRMRRMKTQVQA